MLTPIEHWQQRTDKEKEKDQKKHKRLLKMLERKKGKKLNDLADDLHEQAFEKIDCLDCANCCSTIPPIVNRSDSKRLAKLLGMKANEFESTYLVIDEDGDMVMNSTPCPFLQANNECEVYYDRPKACQQYPHTDDGTFTHNLRLHGTNVQHCPAVFQILEKLDEVMRG